MMFQDTAGTSSGYAEGGGLYALGLIHANHGAEIIEYLLGQVGTFLAPCGLSIINNIKLSSHLVI